MEDNLPLSLEAYALPNPNPNPDPFGDDLFRGLKPGYTPAKEPNHLDIWTLITWGIPQKSSWFPNSSRMYNRGEKLLVETEKGPFIGVVQERSVLKTRARSGSPRKVVREVTPRDLERAARHEALAREAFAFAQKRIERHRLEMNLFNVHVLHSGDKILFHFTAENRVDFRQLVRELAARFSMRIEMRQMGVRDDAKVLGGLGPCGLVLCCTNHLSHFMPVSIRMAKDQNLVLKPQNVSGQCGRLKCCLSYEQEFYHKLRKNMPRNGKRINTHKGMGRVLEVNILQETIRVGLETGEILLLTKEELLACRATETNQGGEESPSERTKQRNGAPTNSSKERDRTTQDRPSRRGEKRARPQDEGGRSRTGGRRRRNRDSTGQQNHRADTPGSERRKRPTRGGAGYSDGNRTEGRPHRKRERPPQKQGATEKEGDSR